MNGRLGRGILAPLVLAPTLLALVAAAPLDVTLAGEALPAEIALEVRTSSDAAPRPLAWRTEGAARVGFARGPAWTAVLRLEPDPSGGDVLDVAVRWTAAAELERAAVRLAWPGDAHALRRDLSLVPLARTVRVGRGTPVLFVAGRAALAGGPGVIAARYEAAGPGRSASATLFLDDAVERPFATYEACVDHLPADAAGHVAYRTLEHKRAFPYAPRRAGDVDHGRATLYAIDEAAPLLPVVVERWARGARAAVVFTDHADRTDPDALRAVLWGASDPRAEGRAGSGFLGRGVEITKSFFVHDRRGGLDDPEIRTLAEDLRVCGSEVALHSITGERDDRDAVRAGLAAVAAWRPVTWIDHQPYTNCEAVCSQGWRSGGPYGIRDLLVEGGVRWVWAAGDVGGFAGARIVNVLGGDPGEPRPALYPLPFDPRLWVFESSMFYAPPGELAAALSDAALETLERERGLFVAHTYLAAAPRTTHRPEHLAALAVRAVPGGLVIDPALDAALARIAARVSAGTLASLTWRDAGDRLRALGDVEVSYRSDGAAEIRNHGEASIEGLTISVPATGLELVADTTLLHRLDDDGASTRVWLDLPPGGRVVVRARRGVVPVPFLPLP